MYAAPAIRFRDPFISKDIPPSSSSGSFFEAPLTSWPSGSGHHHDLARSLTPPPEMNGLQSQLKPYNQAQDRDHGYGTNLQDQLYHRSSVNQTHAREVSNTDYNRPVTSKIPSPRAESRRGTLDLGNDSQSQKRGSQANAIASNLQIPKSVNDSGGSLSELAAQITCLFWFESSDLLNQIENSSNPLQPIRPLVSDAKPTTGFRKWVITVLSTTCVAQNVVLLALLFIHRLKQMNPSVNSKPGSEYRLLTVALMLGNKFLDDNTYTNKTWAEVSGINVGEVHIMEVEFLSNMRYNLFTSEQDWTRWQSLLGRFASFYERASRPQPSQLPMPILPPTSSIHLPLTLPSPPSSNQASPPYIGEQAVSGINHVGATQSGPTPAPSPLGVLLSNNAGPSPPRVRKRSCYEDASFDHPIKRVAGMVSGYTSPQRYTTFAVQGDPAQPIPRLPLPALPLPTSQTSTGLSQSVKSGTQLPPLSIPARAMGLVYPTSATSTQLPLPHMQIQSRNQSPFGGSNTTSPTPLPQSATGHNPPVQISPTYFLQQRNSPYRPVHNVSTLLYPPPSGAMQQRPQNIELSQMYYQPLGKPVQHRQNGRLPYVAQNLWVDGNQPQEMTPVHQWSGFAHASQPH